MRYILVLWLILSASVVAMAEDTLPVDEGMLLEMLDITAYAGLTEPITVNSDTSDDVCYECHGMANFSDGERNMYIDSGAFDTSMHAGMECMDCHFALTQIPHKPDITDKISCSSECHSENKGIMVRIADVKNWYAGSVHDKSHDGIGADCYECHDPHAGKAIGETDKGYWQNVCANCHDSRENLCAVTYKHNSIPAFHFETMDCSTCHVPAGVDLNASNPQYEISLGYLDGDSVTYKHTDDGLTVSGKSFSPGETWIRADNGLIYTSGGFNAIMWLKKSGDSTIPLTLDEIANAAKKCGGKIKDDNGDGVAEANTNNEISAMLTTIGSGSELLKGMKKYYMDKGKLVIEDNGFRGGLFLGSIHSIPQDERPLGADGVCTECHSPLQNYMYYEVPLDPFDANGEVLTTTLFETAGYSDTAFTLMNISRSYMKYAFVIVSLLSVFAMGVHYIFFRKIQYKISSKETYSVGRFNIVERLLHWFHGIGFIFLGFSGIGFWFGAKGIFAPDGILWRLHPIAGMAFFLGFIILAVMWIPSALFKKHDIPWLKVMGGYLGFGGHPEAGRFNAGQKMLFWIIVIGFITLTISGIIMAYFYDSIPYYAGVITYAIHDIASFVLIIGVIAHIYLATLVNPGTIAAMVIGRVTNGWAAFHHPIWLKEVHEKHEKRDKKKREKKKKTMINRTKR